MQHDKGNHVRTSTATKVFWSATEKARVIATAIAIQSERPEMAGLPLLREAIASLPSSRRRKVIALSQAPWFEDGMRSEVRRLASEKIRMDAGLSGSATNLRNLNDTHDSWRIEHAGWREEWRGQLEVLKQILDTLQAAVDRLDVISGKLGSPVPIYAQSRHQSQPQKETQAKTRTRGNAN